MNKFLGIGNFLFTTFCVIFLTTGNSYAGWHDLTQYERNMRILNLARLDKDKYLGNPAGQCKVWVADVAHRAAAAEGVNNLYLPLNQSSPMDYMWAPSSDVVGVQAPPLASLLPGQIIQMRIWYKLDHSAGPGPHTLIVTSNDVPNQMLNVIESNWTAAYTVKQRLTMSYATFMAYLNCSGCSYTVYEVK